MRGLQGAINFRGKLWEMDLKKAISHFFILFSDDSSIKTLP